MRELKVLGDMGYAYDYAEHPLSALAYLKREGLAEIVSQAKTRHGLSRTWGLTQRGLAEYRKLSPAINQQAGGLDITGVIETGGSGVETSLESDFGALRAPRSVPTAPDPTTNSHRREP